ncbi:group I truncated hemoglobin [Halomontanus rarus]|uniref:group I truncated hemoglobin n=1 Tax=Halomontanus rarus TaxID=3034020 RepID=UPI0023E8DE66|nr:group 1 truncated hemoglobin [Halovivax sp. TS33]
MSEQTLYERLGGEDAIAAVVDRFYERVLADDRLVGFFEDVDMQKQRAHQTQFLSAVAGGPVDYTGKDMQTVHADLEIRRSDFDAIATHLEQTLVEFDVDADERNAVLEAFGSYEDAIVTAAD